MLTVSIQRSCGDTLWISINPDSFTLHLVSSAMYKHHSSGMQHAGTRGCNEEEESPILVAGGFGFLVLHACTFIFNLPPCTAGVREDVFARFN